MSNHYPSWMRSAGACALAGMLAAAPIETQAADANPANPEVLTFGIVPQQSASRLARMWAPLMAQLSKETGTEIRFRTAKDIPTFEACLAAGAYDIAYMNPYHYAVFANEPGYRAVARQSEKRLRGLIVVRKDSAHQSIDDLDGQDIAFPSPGAFGASVLPRAEMQNRGIDFEPVYVKSHDSVYRAVAAGLMPAGGGVVRTFNAVDEEVRDQLRVIYQTERYTPHAFAALGSLEPDIVDALQAQLVSMDQALTAQVGMSGIEAATDPDWNDVRGLSLTPEDTGIALFGQEQCPSD